MTRIAHEKLYICPGELHPISRAVHLSRLAAFYPKCRDCALRTDTGHLPTQTVERLQRTERRVERKSLFTTEGVRGVYLNELTRSVAGKMAAAFAGWLWEQSPLIGRTDAAPNSHHAAHDEAAQDSHPAPRDEAPMRRRRNRPSVVIGHDERPSSPDIITGVADSLRRMGCQVIDIGLSTKPCFWFAVDHLQTSAGIYVTGAGCDTSWTGLDLVARAALPLSQGSTLDEIEARLRENHSRPTRHAGPQRTFQAAVPYRAGLWKHFHALRPLTVCYASPTPLLRSTLEQIFEKLPCRLAAVEIPNRARNLADPGDPDVLRIAAAVRQTQAHLGILIDDDAGRCALLDENGTLLESRQVARLLIETVLATQPGGTVAVESPAVDELRPTVEQSSGTCIAGGHTMEELSKAMRDTHAVYGGGDSNRHWFYESFPTCDAILTLAKILEALSQSDAPFSEIIAAAKV